LDTSSEEGRARTRFIKNLSVLEKQPSTMLGVVRQFMDALQGHLANKRMDDIKRMALPQDQEHIPAHVNKSLERAIIQPSYTRLVAVIRRTTALIDDEITCRAALLRSKSQAFFGIKADEISSNNWSSAVYELSTMDQKLLPFEKLAVLMKTARAIYDSV
jgi:hypothetical protein